MSLISLINAFPFGQSAQKGHFLYTRIPQGALDRMSSDNFGKTIRYVYDRSPFYRRRFTELGIRPENIRRPEDLGTFFTTPEDLRANPKDFLCAAPDTAYETTGTTSSRPKRVYFSRREIREAGWSGAVGLWSLGLRPEDRVASSFDYSFWVSGPVLAASCEVIGCFHVEAGRIPPEEFYDRLKDYGITVIVGDPSWVVRLAEVAEKRGPWPVKLLLASGENLTEEARAYVERVWQTDFVLSYGQTEAFGAIGIESRFKEGYHLNEFHNAFEIINRDAEGLGELVYTTLNRRVMPLVRYRSGDLTRFIGTPSKSGIPGRRIEKLRGRIDEWIPTAIGNLAPWMFEPIFAGLSDIGGDWQVAIQKIGLKDRIVLRFETRPEPFPNVRDRVLEAFRAAMPEAWRMVGMGLCELDAEAAAPGTLRTGRKLKRLVDLRDFTR